MFRARYLALHIILTVLAIAPAAAQGVAPGGALSEISVPGGLKAALVAIDDRAAPDRSQFLLEFIRRTYDTPLILKTDQRAATLLALLAQLDRATEQTASAPSPDGSARTSAAELDRAAADGSTRGDDVLPLPLTPSIWIDVVFAGRATTRTLVRSILASREASLFYYALMSLDDDTRAWLATEPALIKELASHHAGALVAAAPGLRVRAGAVRVPGGAPAEPAWEALVGRRVHDPAGFTRTLLTENDGALAWYFGAVAQLSPGEIVLALNLESSDAALRSTAVRRLFAVFQTLAWKLETRAFWRPSLDPALLVSALPKDENGHSALPGNRQFWTAVFAREAPRDDLDTRVLALGDSIDFGSLSAQVFDADALARRSRYNVVLFAARKAPRLTPENARDAVVAVRAAGSYPALVASLERAGLVDLGAYAAAARRAAELSTVGDSVKAVRALAQFQGTIAFVTRTALNGTLAPNALAAAVTSVSAVDPGKAGDYDGRLVQWLTAFVRQYAGTSGSPRAPDPSLSDSDSEVIARVPGDLDRDALWIAAGPLSGDRRYVDWEGTRYRFDVATGEAIRLARLLGENHRPYLTSANALVEIADALAARDLARETLGTELEALVRVGTATGWEGGDAASSSRTDAPRPYRDAVARLRRAAAKGNARNAAKIGDPLRELADDLLGRGLMDLAYAVAMGSPERKPISVTEAASRHDFKGDVVGHGLAGAWRLPALGSRSVPRRTWHIAGSVLGLDVTLAELSLLRLSSKPPARRPTLSDEDRRVMTESVALTQPAALTDAGLQVVLDTLRRGRARLAAIRTDADARALADEIGLGPARTTLLPWLVAHDPGRISASLSPVEILWVGLESRPVDAALQAWGSSAAPRLGCLCVQLLDRRPWETFAGRWNLGVLASSFPDLNLRLVELLSDLQMPAAVLRAVLAAATVDFTDNATSRDPDDRRGPVEFVQALGPDRVEQYLALLTTDGPLFPVGDSSADAAGTGSGKSGASR